MSFHHISAYSLRPSYVMGFAGGRISDVRFSDIYMHMAKEDPQSDRFPCNWNSASGKGAAFFAADAERLTLERMHFDFEGENLFGETVKAEGCEGIRISDILRSES